MWSHLAISGSIVLPIIGWALQYARSARLEIKLDDAQGSASLLAGSLEVSEVRRLDQAKTIARYRREIREFEEEIEACAVPGHARDRLRRLLSGDESVEGASSDPDPVPPAGDADGTQD